jgi:hypothetical protein
MKKIIFSLLFVLSSVNVFSTITSDSIGWRKDIVYSYCYEYDMMVDEEKGQWVIPWNATRDLIEFALSRDGFNLTKTDNSVSWKSSSIFECRIEFKDDQTIKNLGIIITVNPANGPKLAEALKKKVETIHKFPGKYRPSKGNDISYVWLNESCTEKVVSMLSRVMVNSEIYLITLYSSRISSN